MATVDWCLEFKQPAMYGFIIPSLSISVKFHLFRMFQVHGRFERPQSVTQEGTSLSNVAALSAVAVKVRLA